jgi:2-polyprenyl-3-methyl-5-hydroxy-6-metoxy-1,4-benzoquinol methylase
VERENESEILDADGVPDELVKRAYRDLARIHSWLGDTHFVIRAIRQDPMPVRRILDVGCGTGLVLENVRRKLGVEAFGVDVNPRRSIRTAIPTFQADAIRDSLPSADVAFSMHLGHHLSEDDLVSLIRNVGKFCRRFILLDLVRHPLPLALFRLFVAPFVCRIVVADGQKSIRRSYTPAELRRIAGTALAGSNGTFRQSVAPLYARQVVDIVYAHR